MRNKRRVSYLYRTATTNVPLLHSCPGGVKRELIVQDLPDCKSTKNIVTFARFFNLNAHHEKFIQNNSYYFCIHHVIKQLQKRRNIQFSGNRLWILLFDHLCGESKSKTSATSGFHHCRFESSVIPF